MKISIYLLFCFLLVPISCSNTLDKTEKWDVYEIVMEGPAEGNPYMDIDLSAAFTIGDHTIEMPGFYDGDGIYKIRFSPDSIGKWTYVTRSNSEELDGKSGKLVCSEPGPDNHGPLRIVNTFYLEYADGTPFYSVGTTAYQWTSVAQHIQEKTLETLEESPFNKIRMCVFPKNYRYGNETEPWLYPFKREGEDNDLTQPDFEFFRNFDKRIQQLLKMGIQADVILFHPYDKWGYSSMGDEMNLKYVRYMIARISAYRNVWWSLANEWDIPGFKERTDWEGIGTTLQKEDPYQRFRGIHNWYGSEDHFYDHTRPWITHTCTQTSQFYNAIRWRERYNKPLLFDEMRYEGDVPSGWGNLSGEEMASYFWMAGLSGGYPTHGDTYKNTSDDSTEVRWWAKGGYLVGESVARIGYFKSIMEEAPVTEMVPEIITPEDPEDRNNTVYIFSKPGEYYLAYVANKGNRIRLELPGEKNYKMDVIDTWNMNIVSSHSVPPGPFDYQPEQSYTGLRLTPINE
ncbi:MAG: DUF5060 domain-containing protein [Bacteroidales bacterium]|nr:DUF5060 domain-containing protein [Bacteroidales bacterium]